MFFSIDQMDEMSKEAEAIAELMKTTESLLEKSKKNKPKKNKDNIVYVDFSLKNEFEKAKKTRLKLPQILALYHDWAFRTCELARANTNNLDNKAISKMLELNHSIVCTITDILPSSQR